MLPLQPKTQPPVPLHTMFVPQEIPAFAFDCEHAGPVAPQVIEPGLQVVPQDAPTVQATQLPDEHAVLVAVQAVPLLQHG